MVKQKMKFEFNKDGSLKLSETVEKTKEYSKKQLEEAEKNPNKVIICYEEVSNYEDNWIITLPKSVPRSVLYKLKKWTDDHHKPRKGSTWINKIIMMNLF